MICPTRREWLFLVIVWGLLAGGIEAREEKIAWEQAPDVVRATIEKQAKGAKILEVERETDRNGRVTYEAEFMLDGQMVEVNVDADGSLRSVKYGDDDADEGPAEEETPYANLPPAVKKTVTDLTGKEAILKAVRQKERTGYSYLVTWDGEGGKLGARITEQGVVTETREYLSVEQAPPFIKAASLQAFRKGTETRFVRRKLIIYEVEADIEGKTRRVLIAPDGRLVGAR